MVDAYHRTGGNLICAQIVPDDQTHMYGIITPGAQDGPLTEVQGLVEKPPHGTAPSNLSVIGRYILQPEVMRVLETQQAGAGGEIQLTDAMAHMIGQQPFHGVTFQGRRYDCGDKAGYVQANLAVALARDDMGDAVRAFALDLLGVG
jgi:UTP--glucose-1-phosphate uridylyltransferase